MTRKRFTMKKTNGSSTTLIDQGSIRGISTHHPMKNDYMLCRPGDELYFIYEEIDSHGNVIFSKEVSDFRIY